MLVFSKARLVLLSVPKTGSTAYETALAPHAAIAVSAPPELKHAPVFRYNRFFRPMIDRFFDGSFDVVAVMREPLDWLGSWYRYRQRPELAGHANSTHGLSFDDFVTAYCTGEPPPCARVGSQAKFLEPQRNGARVTHLFRYEDQPGLRSFLAARLGVAVEPAPLNRSPSLPLTLSPRTDTRLRRKFAEDFTLWSGIGANGAYTPLPARPKPEQDDEA
ncbi:MAG: gamma-glutamyl kinase [Roseovarius sp.]|uniref:gamma-glutamyl kinase n=1 Tax=Roseovarius sp. TaxID=1486281 RepID=UPI001B6357A1|nr:gamma-glutamyl kinase [Roseovarius sp.]MBQ0749382.1 gamma-glutamyl kinase [Roseovarius sp.]MBQ0809599.1 gamma-glutamyl kinase [Roseovarius sp.]